MNSGKPPLQRVIDLGPCTWVFPDGHPKEGQTCGVVHDRCSGHISRGPASNPKANWGDPCTKGARIDQTVCASHGGNTPQALAGAERRREIALATRNVGALLAATYGQVSEMSGPDQLLDAIHFAGAMATGYRWLLAELPVESEWSFATHYDDKGSITRLVNVEAAGLLGPDHQGQMRLHAYEEGARHWTKLHADLLKTAHQIGLEERRQRFREEQVSTIGAALRCVVEGLGHQLDEPTVVPVVERALRVVAGEIAA